MNEYALRGAEKVAQDLRFSEEQLSLLGRLLSLSENPELIIGIHFEYAKTSANSKLIMYVQEPRELDVRVKLQPKLREQDHLVLMEKIRSELDTRKIPSANLSEHYIKSYQILGLHGIDIYFGFPTSAP